MTTARRFILAVALLAIAAMLAFPPWVTAPEGHPSATSPVGYAFILKPPSMGTYNPRSLRIDYARLLIQSVVVSALAGVVLLLPHSKAKAGR